MFFFFNWKFVFAVPNQHTYKKKLENVDETHDIVEMQQVELCKWVRDFEKEFRAT